MSNSVATGDHIGPQGIQGITGNTGVRGSLWYSGSGVPGTISGQIDNDFYLNTANGQIYELISGVWTARNNITGPAGSGGPIPLTISAISDTYLGQTAFPATVTITPGANHVLHIRLAAYRSGTTVKISLLLCKDINNGYYFAAQEDGNLVNYYYTSGVHSINASGSGTDDLKGPILMDLYFPIGLTTDNGIGMGGYYTSPNVYRIWPVSGKDTHVDMTSTITIAVLIDAVANINKLDYEIL